MTYYASARSKRKIYNTIKSDAEKIIEFAAKQGFPGCKGTYPDCPENPTKKEYKCKNCPVLEEIKSK